MTSKEKIFISNAEFTLETAIKRINESSDFKHSEEIGNLALGYIDCIFNFICTVADKKSQKQLLKEIKNLTREVYKELFYAAIRFGESEEKIGMLVKKGKRKIISQNEVVTKTAPQRGGNVERNWSCLTKLQSQKSRETESL